MKPLFIVTPRSIHFSLFFSNSYLISLLQPSSTNPTFQKIVFCGDKKTDHLMPVFPARAIDSRRSLAQLVPVGMSILPTSHLPATHFHSFFCFFHPFFTLPTPTTSSQPPHTQDPPHSTHLCIFSNICSSAHLRAHGKQRSSTGTLCLSWPHSRYTSTRRSFKVCRPNSARFSKSAGSRHGRDACLLPSGNFPRLYSNTRSTNALLPVTGWEAVL